jgi:hypothetical protein
MLDHVPVPALAHQALLRHDLEAQRWALERGRGVLSCAAANVENPAAASANTAKPVIDRRMAHPRFGCRAGFPIMAPSSTTHYE